MQKPIFIFSGGLVCGVTITLLRCLVYAVAITGITMLGGLDRPAGALTVLTPTQSETNGSNPATVTLETEELDGGSLGPTRVFAESTSNQTLFEPDFTLANPSRNTLGDNMTVFVQASHPTQFSNLKHFTLGAAGMHVKLLEPEASLIVHIQAMANEVNVSGVNQTFEFSESTGCVVGRFCSLGGSETFSVDIQGVNSIGFRWSFLAEGALALEPSLIFNDGFESGSTSEWSTTIP